jgi:hypothetical protein
VSDDLIRAVDEGQYADNAGLCLDALDSTAPVGVPDIDTTLQRPGFHDAAPRMGPHAAVSIPLYAGGLRLLAVRGDLLPGDPVPRTAARCGHLRLGQQCLVARGECPSGRLEPISVRPVELHP